MKIKRQVNIFVYRDYERVYYILNLSVVLLLIRALEDSDEFLNNFLSHNEEV